MKSKNNNTTFLIFHLIIAFLSCLASIYKNLPLELRSGRQRLRSLSEMWMYRRKTTTPVAHRGLSSHHCSWRLVEGSPSDEQPSTLTGKRRRPPALPSTGRKRFASYRARIPGRLEVLSHRRSACSGYTNRHKPPTGGYNNNSNLQVWLTSVYDGGDTTLYLSAGNSYREVYMLCVIYCVRRVCVDRLGEVVLVDSTWRWSASKRRTGGA